MELLKLCGWIVGIIFLIFLLKIFLTKERCCVCGKKEIPFFKPLCIVQDKSEYNPFGSELYCHNSGKCYNLYIKAVAKKKNDDELIRIKIIEDLDKNKK